MEILGTIAIGLAISGVTLILAFLFLAYKVWSGFSKAKKERDVFLKRVRDRRPCL